MNFNWTDPTLVQYFIGLIISLYGASLFGWWWIKCKGASFVFMCVTLLFTGHAIERGVQVYARTLRLMTQSTAWTEASWLWEYKGTVGLIASVLVIGYLQLRVLGYFPIQRYGRRTEDGTTLCTTATGSIIHEMNGPVVYYKCLRCSKEWRKDSKGYNNAKMESEYISAITKN